VRYVIGENSVIIGTVVMIVSVALEVAVSAQLLILLQQ
jgi:hypothetical protein